VEPLSKALQKLTNAVKLLKDKNLLSLMMISLMLNMVLKMIKIKNRQKMRKNQRPPLYLYQDNTTQIFRKLLEEAQLEIIMEEMTLRILNRSKSTMLLSKILLEVKLLTIQDR
jgi:hypothetical protein